MEVDARGFIIPTPKGPSRRYYSGKTYLCTNPERLKRFWGIARWYAIRYGFTPETAEDFAQEATLAYARHGRCRLKLARMGFFHKYAEKWISVIDEAEEMSHEED